MQAQSIRCAGGCHDGRVTAIEVQGLHKAYGEHEAVRGIDFEVRRGEVFGLLGPNGAGKTTTVEILEGYRDRSGGHVSVLGHDPAARDPDLRARVGIVLQSSGIYQYLTVRESVAHWAGFYPAPRDVEEVIALVGLEESAEQRAGKLSGGQQRRSTSRSRSSATPSSCSSTSRPPASTRRRAAPPGTPSARCATSARPSCSPPTTSTRRRRWPTASRSSRTGASSPRARRPSSARAPGATSSPTAAATGAGAISSAHETDDPTTLLHELTGAALARGERLEDLSVTRPTLEDVYLELTAEADDE